MQREILVSGLLNVETNVAVKGFPIPYYPIDYPFFGVTSNVSGVGCNIAKALTALGDKVTLLSFLGQDEERCCLAGLCKIHVEVSMDQDQRSLYG